ncbi:MAG: hypothetical protein RBT11_09800 [Desulfobacterales bacterium]|jgi:hypothetical protein|nr:hypothetical protein [Desulfobacterales bacterium]
MDTEFHFHMTGIIAYAAGFTQKEARTIAYACEYTDENDETFRVKDRRTEEIYENYISQTMNILKPRRHLMRIYPVFHFIPGDYDAETARRKDGKMHLLVTTPDNEIANDLIDAALKVQDETRLHRIGIATHAYADTWAHQNFVGWYDYFNNIGLDIKPDIGHADAEHHPDWPSHRWEDNRLVEGEINNTARFLEAAEKIYKKYRQSDPLKSRKPKMNWETLCEKLANAMGTLFSGAMNWYRENRMRQYLALAPWLEKFDETKWFDNAIEKNVIARIHSGLCHWREDVEIEKTDWFLFQDAVKAHQALAMDRLNPIFGKMGVDLHDH